MSFERQGLQGYSQRGLQSCGSRHTFPVNFISSKSDTTQGVGAWLSRRRNVVNCSTQGTYAKNSSARRRRRRIRQRLALKLRGTSPLTSTDVQGKTMHCGPLAVASALSSIMPELHLEDVALLPEGPYTIEQSIALIIEMSRKQQSSTPNVSKHPLNHNLPRDMNLFAKVTYHPLTRPLGHFTSQVLVHGEWIAFDNGIPIENSAAMFSNPWCIEFYTSGLEVIYVVCDAHGNELGGPSRSDLDRMGDLPSGLSNYFGFCGNFSNVLEGNYKGSLTNTLGKMGGVMSVLGVACADDKWKATGSALASAAVGVMWAGSLAETALGVGMLAIGCPPAAVALGLAAVGLVGAYYVGKCGGVVGDYIHGVYDSFFGGAGCKDNGTGGVELRKFSVIGGFCDAKMLLKEQHIFGFSLDCTWASIATLIPKILLPGVQCTPAKFVQTIFQELMHGILIENTPPVFSLHFNDNHTLYPILHSYYQNTIVGTVMGFLDYFLKGFVNGCVYSEEFLLRGWTGSVDPTYLRHNVIDIRKHLKDHNLSHLDYKSLREQHSTDSESGAQNSAYGLPYLSAFRIIGYLAAVKVDDGVFVPTSGYVCEHDLNAKPDLQAVLDLEKQTTGSFPTEHRELVTAYNKMHHLIESVMPKVPMFAPYFEILKIIAFAASYVESAQRSGKISVLDNCFTNGEKYTAPFPKLMPPLAVKCSQKMPINLTLGDVVSSLRTGLSDTQQCCLDVDMHAIVMEERSELQPSTVATIHQRINALTGARLQPALTAVDVAERSVEELKVKSTFGLLEYYISLMLVNPARQLDSFLEDIIEKHNELLQPHEITSLKNCIGEAYQDMSLSKKFTFVEQQFKPSFTAFIIAAMERSRVSAVAGVPALVRAEAERIVASTPNAVVNEAGVNSAIESITADINTKHATQLTEVTSELNAMFTSNIELCMSISSLPTVRMVKTESPLYGLSLLKSLQLSVYGTGASDCCWNSRIVGGCVLRKTHNVALHATKLTESLQTKLIAGAEHVIDNGKQFWRVAMKLRDIFSFDALSLIPQVDGNEFNEKSALPLLADTLTTEAQLTQIAPVCRNATSFGGQHLAHMMVALSNVDGLSLLTVEELNHPQSDGCRAIHLACVFDRALVARVLIDKGVDLNCMLPNGMYPLLMATQNKCESVARLLLALPVNRIGDVSRAGDTGMSPLHWAVTHNWPDIVRLLLQHGASFDCRRRKDGMTPFHLAAHLGKFDCLNYIMGDGRRPDVNATIDGKKTALHCACAAGHLSCVRLLLKNAGTKRNELDDAKNSPAAVAMLNGHSECALMVMEGMSPAALQACIDQKNFQGQSITNIAISLHSQDLLSLICSKLPKMSHVVEKELSNATENSSKDVFSFSGLYNSLFPRGRTAASAGSSENLVKALVSVIAQGNVALANKMYEAFRSNSTVFTLANQRSIIEAAVDCRDVEMLSVVSKMVDFGNVSNYAVVHHAAAAGLHDWIAELKKYGLPLLHALRGETALHVAARNCNDAVVLELLSSCSDSLSFDLLKEILLIAVKEGNSLLLVHVFLNPHCSALLRERGHEVFLSSMDVRTCDILIAQRLKVFTQRKVDILGMACRNCRLEVAQIFFADASVADMRYALKEAVSANRLDVVLAICNAFPGLRGTVASSNAMMSQALSGDGAIITQKLRQMETCLQNTFLAALEERQPSRADGPRRNLRRLLESFPGLGYMDVISNLPLLHAIVISQSYWALDLVPAGYDVNYKVYFDSSNKGHTAFDFLSVAGNMSLAEKFDMIEKFYRRRLNKNATLVAQAMLSLVSENLITRATMDGEMDGLVDVLLKVLPPNEIGADGISALHVLSQFELTDARLSPFVRLVSESVINSKNQKLQTPLMCFARKMNRGVVVMLIAKKANTLCRDSEGNSALHHLLLSGKANNNNMLQCAAELCKVNPSIILLCNTKGESPWILACRAGSVGIIELFANYFAVEQLDAVRDKSGLKAIHHAAIGGHCDALRALVLRHGVWSEQVTVHTVQDGILVTEGDCTALHLAATNNMPNAFMLLLDLGANSFAENKENVTPPVVFASCCSFDVFRELNKHPGLVTTNRNDCLVRAVENKTGGLEIIKYLLPMCSFNEAVDSDGNPLLLCAAKHDNPHALIEFLRNGANPFSQNREGCNVFHMAASSNSIACLGACIHTLQPYVSISDVSAMLNRPNNNGNTPLHIACEKGNLDFVLLLARQSEIDCWSVVNNKGLTPLNSAITKKHDDVALFLSSLTDVYSCGDNVRKEYKSEITAFYAKHAVGSQECTLAIEMVADLKAAKERTVALFAGVTALSSVNLCKIDITDISKQFLDRVGWSEATARQLDVNILLHPIVIHNLCARTAHYHVVDRLFAFVLSQATALVHVRKVVVLFATRLLPYVEAADLHLVVALMERLAALDEVHQNHCLWRWIERLITPTECQFTVNWAVAMRAINKFLDIVLGQLNSLPEPTLPKLSFTCTDSMLHVIVAVLGAVEPMFLPLQIKLINDIPVLMPSSVCVSVLPSCHIVHRALFADAIQAGVIEGGVTNHPSQWKAAMRQCLNAVCGRSTASSADILSAIEFLNDVTQSQSLNGEQKRVVIAHGSSYITQASFARHIRGWGAVAETLLIEYGPKTFSDFSKLYNARSGVAQFASINELVSVASRLIEIENEAIVTQCLAEMARRRNSDSLDTALVTARNEKFGKDRDIDEILLAFAGRGTGTAIKPHLFSFDGTPVFSLSAPEIIQLRVVFDAMVASTACTDKNTLCVTAQALGRQFSCEPSLQLLGELVALICEGFKLTMNLRPFHIQCLSVIAFLLPNINNSELKGRLEQIATGEGKSIIVAMLAIVMALQGKFVDIVTSNQYLAIRDSERFEPVFNMFGLSVSHICVANPGVEHFNAQIVYGTNVDFQWAVLREGINMRGSMATVPLGGSKLVPRTADVVIVDEADNMMLDSSQNAARIGHTSSSQHDWVYVPIYQQIAADRTTNSNMLRAVLLQYASSAFAADLATISNRQLTKWIASCKRAQIDLVQGRDYVVRPNAEGKKQVQVMDLTTGRISENTRWSGGTHEFVEVKEGIPVRPESSTIASMCVASFFENYSVIFGLTGTVGETAERKEIERIFKVDSCDVPPHRVCLRRRLPTRIFPTHKLKLNALVATVKEHIAAGRPVLVLCLSKNDTDELAALLRKNNVKLLVLSEVQDEDEDYILFKAGQAGAVTVATNNAGRGTDILLTKEALLNGGLHVIFTLFPDNLRVECQGIGRSGRQGQPGTNEILISSDEKQVLNLPQVEIATGMDAVEELYARRTASILQQSQIRELSCEIETKRYAVLCEFFASMRFLKSFFSSTHTLFALQQVLETTVRFSTLCTAPEATTMLLIHFQQQWATYFTELCEPEHKAKVLLTPTTVLYKEFLASALWLLTPEMDVSTEELLQALLFQQILNYYS